MQEMTLYIGDKTYSSWSLRAWLACQVAGVPFKEICVPLDTDDFRTVMRQNSPTGCVPALHHGDAVVWDSLAIITYIDHLKPEAGFWPKEITAYAHALSISAEMHSGLTHLRGACPMNFRRKWSGLSMSKPVARNVARVDAIWTQTREKFGGDGDFLFGCFGAADMMFAPVVGRFDTYGLPRSNISQAYMDAVLAHPAMVRWLKGAAAETHIVAVDEIDPETKILGD